MTNGKAVNCAIYIEGYKYITEDEKRENKAKFEAWYSDFLKRYEETIKNGGN